VNAHVFCTKCNAKIPLAITCRIESPLLFIATCPVCGCVDVYSFTDIIEADSVRCEEMRRKFNVVRGSLSSILSDLLLMSSLRNVVDVVKLMIEKIIERCEP
jgi:hypothetical protein